MSKEKIKIEYKKYEMIDLGDLAINGKVVSPGDITVRQRRRIIFNRKLFIRKKYNDLNKKNIIKMK